MRLRSMWAGLAALSLCATLFADGVPPGSPGLPTPGNYRVSTDQGPGAGGPPSIASVSGAARYTQHGFSNLFCEYCIKDGHLFVLWWDDFVVYWREVGPYGELLPPGGTLTPTDKPGDWKWNDNKNKSSGTFNWVK